MESSTVPKLVRGSNPRELRDRPVRPPRRLGRDVATALASVCVVGLLAAYVVAAPSVKLTASFGSPVPRPGTTALVAGRIIEPGGGALPGPRVEAWRGRHLVAAVLSDGSGQFQMNLPGRCAVYVISLHAKAQDASVETGTRRRLCPGDALPVEAQVVTYGHFLWVPGPR